MGEIVMTAVSVGGLALQYALQDMYQDLKDEEKWEQIMSDEPYLEEEVIESPRLSKGVPHRSLVQPHHGRQRYLKKKDVKSKDREREHGKRKAAIKRSRARDEKVGLRRT